MEGGGERQTDRQTDKQADRQAQRQTGSQAGRSRERQRWKQTDRDGDLFQSQKQSGAWLQDNTCATCSITHT